MVSQATRSVSHGQVPMTPNSALPPVAESSSQTTANGLLKPPETVKAQRHRASSPPAFDPSAQLDGAILTTGRFSPNTPTRRRASLQLARRNTRSIHSDVHLDEPVQDEDAARWAEHIRNKRASKRQRQDTDDDRVVVGTKVDQNHVNFATAYNMLTGIRCCVSRTNAKLDRDLTDADFQTKHKFSFDISGSELTPSSKYDFKFKDYAPFVFRKLRAIFQLDPADYLMSLTAKYILSELGSPGKSGSFFYFSRDYKYIIKTIHHAEHKFLRVMLKEYYTHVVDNPNTLLSQFYGLHRVKIPYGRKIHFVVMNNLFPPHRDIHRTFDLKGSTIGRDFKEEDLEKNPRATLKDLNWLRRNLHLEFGPTKKEAFVTQMQKDVALLQRLKIMDYSLLVGIHDLERGNEENLRDKTLRVFQPAGEPTGEGGQQHLARTPSVMENAKRIKEMREAVKRQKPVPISQTLDKMPDEAHRSPFFFYADDGGFRATHEDDTPGEEIYYLGIIDCLTRYNLFKRVEHAWKGMGGHESQISPIPPERYGDRFTKFISGITKSRERAEQERLSSTMPNVGKADAGLTTSTVADHAAKLPSHPPLEAAPPTIPQLDGTTNPPSESQIIPQHSSEEFEEFGRNGMSKVGTAHAGLTTFTAAEYAAKISLHPLLEAPSPIIPALDGTTDYPSEEGRATFSCTPVTVTSHRMMPSDVRGENHPPTIPQLDGVTAYPSEEAIVTSYCTPVTVTSHRTTPSDVVREIPPPTPPKLDGTTDRRSEEERRSWQSGGLPPPTPPKETRRMVNATDDSYIDAGCFGPRTTKIYGTQDKELPLPPSMVSAMREISANSMKEITEKRSGLFTRQD